MFEDDSIINAAQVGSYVHVGKNCVIVRKTCRKGKGRGRGEDEEERVFLTIVPFTYSLSHVY